MVEVLGTLSLFAGRVVVIARVKCCWRFQTKELVYAFLNAKIQIQYADFLILCEFPSS